MNRITVSLEPEIDAEAVGHLRSVLHNLGPDEEVTIVVESADAQQADPVISLLAESGFDYQSKGSHDGKSYYINARRKAH